MKAAATSMKAHLPPEPTAPPAPAPAQPTPEPTPPPIEKERGPQHPVELPGKPHEPERVRGDHAAPTR